MTYTFSRVRTQLASNMAQDRANIRSKPIQIRSGFQVDSNYTASRFHIALDLLHVALGWHKLAPMLLHERADTHQESPICAQVGPKMGEAGPNTVQSTTIMAPCELKFATSWPPYCMKTDISQTYIQLTTSFEKTMICRIPHAQFAS